MANSQVAYINETVPIPRVTEVSSPPELIGGGGRTVDGTYRYDSIAMKDSFKIVASYLTPSEFSAISSYLKSINGGLTTFWIDDFGGDSTTDSVAAHVIISKVERKQFSRNGVWYNNGKEIELEVTIV